MIERTMSFPRVGDRWPVLMIAALLAGTAVARAQDSALVVRSIVITGNERTEASVILREMVLAPGDSLTSEKLARDQEHIYNLGLFTRVDLSTETIGDSATIFVAVRERWYFFPFPVFGIRYRDIHNIYYGAGVADVNFRGRNEKVFASVAFGYDRWLSLSYQNPKISDDDLFMATTVRLQRTHSLDPNDEPYEDTHLVAMLTLGKRFGLYQTLSLSGGYEVWQVANTKLGRTASASGRDAFVSLDVSYRYDTRNIREYATAGSFVGLSLYKSGIGNRDVDVTNASIDLRTFIPLGGEAAVGLRTFLNSAWGGVVPPYRQSYFGYEERVRGYFSEKSQSEDTFGASAELRLPILVPRYFIADFVPIPQFQSLRYGLYFALFADAGRGWNRGDQPLERPWLFGTGAGLHFLLPYGFTIRTEAALNDRGRAEAFIDYSASF